MDFQLDHKGGGGEEQEEEGRGGGEAEKGKEGAAAAAGDASLSTEGSKPLPHRLSHAAPSPSVVWEPPRGSFWELCNADSGGPAQIYSVQNLGQPVRTLYLENPASSPGGLSKAALSCHRGGLWKVPQARAHHALGHSGA